MIFEKVSATTWTKDILKAVPHFTESEVEQSYRDIKLPKRSTKHSAGYDFVTPIRITLPPHSSCSVPTGIKCRFSANEKTMWYLALYIRSSIGIKRGVIMSNGTGIIDADFYNNPDNEGDITLALTNTSSLTQVFDAGERICQGIFTLYGLTEDDNADTERTSGIGSTGK